MDGSTLDRLRDLRRHVSVAHHLRGRIRLRLGLEALGSMAGLDPAWLRLPFQDLEGIRSIRINPAALSAVIEYDPATLPPAWWDEAFGADESRAMGIADTVSDRWKNQLANWNRPRPDKEDRQ
jgi:hypothetical protein